MGCIRNARLRRDVRARWPDTQIEREEQVVLATIAQQPLAPCPDSIVVAASVHGAAVAIISVRGGTDDAVRDAYSRRRVCARPSLRVR